MRKVRIAHAADIHIGCGRGSIPDYLERSRIACAHLVASFRETQVDAVLIAGDVFHRKDMHPDEIGVFIGWCNELDGLGIPVIIQAGNHDLITKEYTLLDALADVEAPLRNVQFVTRTTKLEVLGLNVLVMGQPDNHRVGEVLEEHKDVDILMLHEAVIGGRYNGIASTAGVDLSALPHIPYIALGDFHERQILGAWAVYPGSPYQTRFGEDSLERGYIRVEFNNRKVLRANPVDIPQPTPLVRVFANTQEQLAAQIPANAWIAVHVGPGVSVDGLPAHVISVNAVPDAEASLANRPKLELSRPLVDPLDGFEEMVKRGGYELDDGFMAEIKAEAQRIVATVGVGNPA